MYYLFYCYVPCLISLFPCFFFFFFFCCYSVTKSSLTLQPHELCKPHEGFPILQITKYWDSFKGKLCGHLRALSGLDRSVFSYVRKAMPWPLSVDSLTYLLTFSYWSASLCKGRLGRVLTATSAVMIFNTMPRAHWDSQVALVVKNPAANAGDTGVVDLIPG